MHAHRWLTVVLLLAAAIGCGKGGVARYPLSGKINYDGKPIPAGEISFEPDTSRGNKGPSAVVKIVAGKYETAPNFGVVGGPHLARIRGFDGIPVTLKEERPMFEGTPMFSEQTVAIDLPGEATTHDIDLPAVRSE